ncbi:MAG: methylmalonyl-CoA mutase family protein [Litorimonas sp.]
MSNLNIKADFLSASWADWLALVDKGLRGAAFDTLIHKTEDDIVRGPLLCADDLPPSLTALGRVDLPLLDGRSWHIAAPVRDPDLNHANIQLLEDLKGGSSAVRVERGPDLSTRNNLKRLLEGVFCELVPIQFATGIIDGDSFENILSLERLKTAHVWTGLDPVKDADALAAKTQIAPARWRLMSLSPADIHEAGGTEVQEIAGLAASLVEAMRLHGAQTVCQHMVIDLAADRETHLTIAKFRAARRIILRIADAFGEDGSGIPLCAVTSLRMMQTEDAWTNLLRVMSAGFGAVIGGADVITTRPFTDGLGHATPFAHRIARNMQLMMMEESHLGQVSDAAHGSYWHENMTEQLAQSAWALFQQIESAGGIKAYKESGKIAADLNKSIAKRAAKNAPILGVTLHPAKDVKTPEVRS